MTTPAIHQAYGLAFQSDLALPELPGLESGRVPDVRIVLAPIGEGISEPAGEGGLWKTAPGRFELNVPEVARYLVQEGRRIVVEAAKDANVAEVRTYLLGSVMGALLQQRGFFLLHAGAFVVAGRAVLICGRSGAGKSTVLQGMAQRGYATMSDDLVPIRMEGDNPPVALPGYPFTRLCADAAAHYELGVDSERFLVQSGQKLVMGIDMFAAGPHPISHIFCLKSYNRKEVNVQWADPLKGGSLLSRFSYRTKFLRGMGQLTPHFNAAVGIARQVPVAMVHRPGTLDTLASLLDRIEREVKAVRP